MTNILITSDWHLDAVTAGVRRMEGHRLILQRMLDTIAADDIQVACLLGDYYDPGSMAAHLCESYLTHAVGVLSTVVDVIVLAGNHDVLEGSYGASHVTTLSGMPMATEFGFGHGRVHVVERPKYLDVADIRFVCLPYVPKHVRKMHYASDVMETLCLNALLPSGEPVIVLGHLMVDGARLGNESEEFARGSDLQLPPQLGILNAHGIFNGHYHIPQTVAFGNQIVQIPGSPQRLTFADTDECERGFLVVKGL